MQEGKAVTIKKIFSRETSISTSIQADPAIVWALLTNAADFPRWNSTVVSIEGEIKAGGQIKLISTLDPKRTFNLKVKEFEPTRRLAWGDTMGKRVYTVEKSGGANEVRGERVQFTMTEKIGGPIFPLFGRFIPPFDESFEQFVADLKKEAETIHNAQS